MELSKDGRSLPVEAYRAHRGLMLTAVLCIGWRIPSSVLPWAWGTWVCPYGRSSMSIHMKLAVFESVAAAGGIILLVGMIAFLYWLRGAYRNLQPLGSAKREISPGLPATPRDAVVSFLIPIVQFVRARRVMVHLWRESQPTPAVLPDGTVLRGKTRLVNWWYAIWLSSFLTAFVGHARYAPFIPSLSGLLKGVAAILCGVMVWTIEKRQAEQFRDLQLRQPAPPVTDQLR